MLPLLFAILVNWVNEVQGDTEKARMVKSGWLYELNISLSCYLY